MSKQLAQKLMPEEEALAYLLAHCVCRQQIIQIPLEQALGFYLAEDLVASVYIPPWDNSAMDGFALDTGSLNLRDNNKDVSGHSLTLPVSQRIPAGKFPEALAKDTVARIFTGAPIPQGADAVIRQEDCQLSTSSAGERVSVPLNVQSGNNIRRKGEDVSPGDLLLKKGTKIRPQEMGLLASLGFADIKVFRKLKVAVLSSGDELVDPKENPNYQLAPGQIFNSNRYTLAGLIEAMGFEILDFGIIADDLKITEATLKQAALKADCVISSGGVSVGEEDHLKSALENVGQLGIWKLAIKPGKPLAFGSIESGEMATPFFGLPGNPAAVLITFCLFVRPYLMKLSSGQEPMPPLMMSATADFNRINKGIRKEYLRARYELEVDGSLIISIFSNQSSGMLSSACWANAFIPIKPEQKITKGDKVSFIPMSEWL